jgi:ketosteroid isomerase-like protein
MASRRSQARNPTTTRRKPARKQAARKASPRKAARKASPRKGSRKSAKPKAPRSLEALARKFVEAAQRPEAFVVAELYTPDCVSIEASGATHHGHQGIEAKLAQWEAMQNGVKWTLRNVFVGDGVICIEWDAEVSLRDGRVVQMPEVAVHEVEDGRIARERYYYNPMVFAPT